MNDKPRFPSPQLTKHVVSGFTLAELLIALTILAVIATFTIPKVLQNQQNSAWNAQAKEVASMISGAYQAYLSEHDQTSTIAMGYLTPYMNYVKADTSSQISAEGTGTQQCDATHICLFLANGSAVVIWNTVQFGGTSSLNAVPFIYDPDGRVGGAQGMVFWLYYSGRIRTRSSIEAGTTCASCSTWNPGTDPDWFSWN